MSVFMEFQKRQGILITIVTTVILIPLYFRNPVVHIGVVGEQSEQFPIPNELCLVIGHCLPMLVYIHIPIVSSLNVVLKMYSIFN